MRPIHKRTRAYRDLLGRTMIVNLNSGESYRGVLVEESTDLLQLGNVDTITPNGPRPVDGRVIIERDQINIVQLPEA